MGVKRIVAPALEDFSLRPYLRALFYPLSSFCTP